MSVNCLPFRFAQLGVTQPHASGYRDLFRLFPAVSMVAAYDLDSALAEQTLRAEGWSGPVFADVDTLLSTTQPDLVCICLPPALTPAAIIRATGAGCHVLAEKPCARTAAEFAPAAAAITATGVQFATGFLRRASPVAREMRDLVAAGILGRLQTAQVTFVTASVERRGPAHWMFQAALSGGGILHWLGGHWLDLLWCVTRQEVSAVAATLTTVGDGGIDVEDTVHLSLRYADGLLASLTCAYGLALGSDRLAISLFGSDGWLTWAGIGPELHVESRHPAWATAPIRTMRFDGPSVPAYGGTMGRDLIAGFLAACATGDDPPFTPGDVMRVLHIIDAAHASARANSEWLPVPAPSTLAAGH